MSTSQRKIKLAISLTPELIRRVRDEVARGRARSVSAWIEHAIRAQLAAEADLDALLADVLDATGGPVTPEEREWARALLR